MAVPKLRFKAEDGSEFPEWEEMKLKDYCVYCKERNRSKVYIGTENMKKDFSGIEVDENRELAEGVEFSVGDILMSNIRPYLKKVWLADKSGVCSSDVLVFRPQRIYSNFLYYIIASEKFIEYVMSAAKGSKMPRGDKKHIMEMQLYSPSLPEQQKIADFLSTIDSIISSQKEELSAWEQRKKGVMQKLFSQEVRFKADDGSEFPEWEEKRLGDYLQENKNRNIDNRYSKNDVLSVSGEYGVVNQIDFQGRSFAGKSVGQYHILPHRGIVYTKSPLKLAPYGIIKSNQGNEGIVSTLYAVFDCKSNCDSLFIDYFFSLKDKLNHYLKPLVNIGAKHDMKISNERFLSGLVVFPSLKEQQKIADCLSSIDEVIQKEKEELEKWQELKKGLLQQMFV